MTVMKWIAVIGDEPTADLHVPLEAGADDLQARLGWRHLLGLVLEAVLAEPMDSALKTGRTRVMLTVITYCYAARTFAAQDIEAATRERAEVGYITRGMALTAADLKRFRRAHRTLVERCLAHVLAAAAAELAPEEFGIVPVAPVEADIQARRRVACAVQFDAAFSD